MLMERVQPILTERTSAAWFDEWILLPENADQTWELVDGELSEKMPTNMFSSKIALRVGRHIDAFVEEHDLGHVTGADGGYWVGDDRYAPDVAFISKARQPEPSYEGYNPLAPDLAVEVISPTDKPAAVRRKVVNYLAAGVVVWLIDAEAGEIEVYIPNQLVQVLGREDILDGGTVLPNFQLPVSAVLPPVQST